MKKGTALVAGAQGVIGRNLIAELAVQGGWDIIGLSRRGGADEENIRHVAIDLLDPDDTRQKLAPLSAVTHVFYAAYQDRGSWAELVAPNVAMLANLLDGIEAAAPGLRHVSLMQGYKVYGAHLGPFKTPARETDPPPMPPEFNFDQQRVLEARRQGKAWTWSAMRPSVVGGVALGNPMNLVVAIAAYASLSKELGLPLRFPGKLGAYDKLIEMTDSGLLARATIWAASEPRAANQAFNINNGDLFRWNDMWPRIARFSSAPSWPTRSRCGTRWSKSTVSLPRPTRMSRPGPSPISSSPGTMTSSPMAARRAVSAFMTMSTARRCSSGILPS